MSRQSPLRILVVTSRPLLDAANEPLDLLDIAEERRRIEAGVRQAGAAIELHFLPEATSGALGTALRRPWDAIHFTGHGTAAGHILLEDGLGGAHPLAKEDLKKLFADAAPPLVVLSACFSEAASNALLEAGVAAVIAVDARTPIADLAAIISAEHFYAALAEGRAVRDALDAAKRAVALDPRVGDAHPPGDEDAAGSTPWSERFALFGDTQLRLNPAAGEVRLSGAGRVTGNLPTRNTNFVGRARDIGAVIRAYAQASSPRAAIWGAGGLGKTELAKAVAWWYAERARIEAVLWVSASLNEGEYRLTDLDSLLSAAARVFALPIQDTTSPEERKRVVRDFLGERRALVVLDNWETVKRDDRGTLWRFILSLPDRVRVLITSRDHLPPREAFNLELDAMAPQEAVELFVKVARNTGYFDRNPILSAEESTLLYAICERLNGYPLALEVVAGQTVSRTLGAIWDDLPRLPRNVLESRDEITGEPRGIWTSLDLSYNALPESERAVFRRASVLMGPAEAEDIAAVVNEDGAVQSLDSLVRRSLIRMREGRYTMLPLVRDYAESKLTEAGESPVDLHVRALNHFNWKGSLEDRLTASEHLYLLAMRYEVNDLDEIRITLEGEAAPAKTFNVARRFVDYVSIFHPELVTRGYWFEARRKAEQMVAAARKVQDRSLEADTLAELANMLARADELDSATSLYVECIEILKELGDERRLASLYHNLGNIQRDRRDYAAALQLFEKSLAIFDAANEKARAAMTRGEIAIIYSQIGEPAKAIAQHEENLAIFIELGDEEAIRLTLNNLGTIYSSLNGYAKAQALFEESLKLAQARSDKKGIASGQYNLGLICHEQGDLRRAMALYREALTAARELGDKGLTPDALFQVAAIDLLTNNISQAEERYLECREISEEIGDRFKQGRILHQLGMLAQQRGEYDKAREFYEESLNVKRQTNDEQGASVSLHQLGNLEFPRKKYDDALRYYGESLAIKRRLNDEPSVARGLAQQGAVELARQRYDESCMLYEEALAVFRKYGLRIEIAQVLFNLGQIAEHREDDRKALLAYREAYLTFKQNGHPLLDLLIDSINELRSRIGETRFDAIWREKSSYDEPADDADGEADGETDEAAFLTNLVNTAIVVVKMRRQGSGSERAEWRGRLASMEELARSEGLEDVARYFEFLRGWLAEEDVSQRAAALSEPFKTIAEQVMRSAP